MTENRREMIQQVATELTKKLTDEGKLVEAGFAAFQHLAMSKDAPPQQVSEMRLAWMAGADHLFSSIMIILDAGAEPTEKDMHRMDLINTELERWRAVVAERVQPSQGRA